MADIVNLRRVKKARKREDEAAQAAENRVRHGRTKAERAEAETERTRAERLLDGARKE